MKKKFLIIALIPMLLVGCKKPDNVFDFSGTMVGYVECNMQYGSLSDFDYGLVLAVDTPDSIGKDYTDSEGAKFHNCVILYRTKSRFRIGDKVSGSMFLDDKYSKAYCQFHYELGLPEAVCYSLN